MAAYSQTTVTLAGRQALAYSLISGLPLKIIRIEIGKGPVPSTIEDLTGLVEKVADVQITNLSNPSDGISMIRGTLRNNEIATAFRLSEIGVIVRVGDGPEVLFSYAHAGETGDYIPAGGGTSMMEKVFTLSLLSGNAEVLVQDIDPNAAATLEDIERLKKDLNIEEIRTSIKEADEELEAIKKDLEEYAKGYVKLDGDEMTGPLKAPKFIGPLEGSADAWRGWKIYNSITELNVDTRPEGEGENTLNDLPESPTIQQIIAKLPVLTRLVHYFPALVGTMPAIGILDIQKISEAITIACFSALDGRAWSGINSGSNWSGWNETAALVPPGTILMYGGSAGVPAPLGFIFAHGQYVSRATYAVLFSIYGGHYGTTDSSNFKVPDLRGQFVRGMDNNRGIDPGRGLGTEQADAIRDIYGFAGAGAQNYGYQVDGASGAFHLGGAYYGEIGAGGGGGYRGIYFNSSRVVPTANENRPKNIAVNFIIKY